ncbi:MAG: hypothetical protein ACRYF3_16830 [Janthinobacterium lividum]
MPAPLPPPVSPDQPDATRLAAIAASAAADAGGVDPGLRRSRPESASRRAQTPDDD